VLAVKCAVTERSAVMATLQEPEPVQSPDQWLNEWPGDGSGLNVMGVVV
jgi:hypothetical protein